MRALLLAAAASLTAIILPVAPAQALDPAGMGFTSSSASGVTVHRGPGINHRSGGFTVGDDRHGDRNRRTRSEVDMVTYGGEWALYNNRSWESDSYNDWWHDQPWRSYPKWVSTNQNCERMWWSGGGWRC
jgi:hypothetical protein